MVRGAHITVEGIGPAELEENSKFLHPRKHYAETHARRQVNSKQLKDREERILKSGR